MERFARLVLRHRRIVVAVWLVLFLAGGVAAGRLSDRLSFDFSLPGQPGDTAERSLVGTSAPAAATPWCRCSTDARGQKVADHRDDIAGSSRRCAPGGAQVPRPGGRLRRTGDDRFVTSGGTATFALVQGPAPTGFGPGSGDPVLPVLERRPARPASGSR